MAAAGGPTAPGGTDFVSRVLEAVDAIPPGRVMTYGDVAAAIGSRAARGVGQVMAYYGSDVPWWRVVRASGHPASQAAMRTKSSAAAIPPFFNSHGRI